MTYDLTLRIWRGDAEGGELTDYVVPVEEGEVVLDAVHHVQELHASDLAVRWNCKAGKCGSCSAEINGRPRLMCLARLSTFPTDEPITVTPMRAFPVLRDLVTDVSFNYAKAREVPAFAPAAGVQTPYRMQQVDVERSQEFRKCIECFLCQDTCHVVRDHEDNKEAFSGPRFFLRYAELEMHPMDTGDRRRMAQESRGLGLCNITKCCTEVCPESIKITDNAIIPLKERVADVKYDPLTWLGSKIFRRGQRGGESPPPQDVPAGIRTQADSGAHAVRSESDVPDDPSFAGARVTGGVPNPDAADQGSTTGTTPSGDFVGRVSGQDTGMDETSGGEKRALAEGDETAGGSR